MRPRLPGINAFSNLFRGRYISGDARVSGSKGAALTIRIAFIVLGSWGGAMVPAKWRPERSHEHIDSTIRITASMAQLRTETQTFYTTRVQYYHGHVAPRLCMGMRRGWRMRLRRMWSRIPSSLRFGERVLIG